MEAAGSVSPSPARRTRSRVRPADRLGRGLLWSNAALVFGFLYLPVLILIVFSFNDTRSVAVFTGFSTEWYVLLAANLALLEAARNSLLVGLIAMVAATVIGTMTALAMDRFRFRYRTAFEANLYLPIVIPEIVMGISLLLFFNQALFPFLETATGYRGSTGLHTITVSHIAFDIPFVYIIVRARLADFDKTLEEAAQDLGANEWRTFRRITLPLLMPGIIGGALMAFTLSLDDYLITVFTKGVRDQTMPLYIYSLVRRGVTPEINALSTALLGGSIGLVVLSLTAQGGGPVYTRAMSVGAYTGAVMFGLFDLARQWTAGVSAAGGILLDLALIGTAVFLIRSIRNYREELPDANPAGRVLSVLTVLVVTAAMFFSLVLLI
ncbi:MAG TPA: ABC transporter permease [Anaerolineales bacterium]|nr:ABC transporter permease [Anaerolineales bacterium]